eukprot:1010198-Alexandrium_andersonii.AAC.1
MAGPIQGATGRLLTRRDSLVRLGSPRKSRAQRRTASSLSGKSAPAEPAELSCRVYGCALELRKTCLLYTSPSPRD